MPNIRPVIGPNSFDLEMLRLAAAELLRPNGVVATAEKVQRAMIDPSMLAAGVSSTVPQSVETASAEILAALDARQSDEASPQIAEHVMKLHAAFVNWA